MPQPKPYPAGDDPRGRQPKGHQPRGSTWPGQPRRQSEPEARLRPRGRPVDPGDAHVARGGLPAGAPSGRDAHRLRARAPRPALRSRQRHPPRPGQPPRGLAAVAELAVRGHAAHHRLRRHLPPPPPMRSPDTRQRVIEAGPRHGGRGGRRRRRSHRGPRPSPPDDRPRAPPRPRRSDLRRLRPNGLLLQHDAEDPANLVHLGITDHGEDVEINRRAAESDLLVYVNINLVAMDGGHKSVATGLASYRA